MAFRVSRTRTFMSEIILTTRNAIYKLGYRLTSSLFNPLLKTMSLVPTVVRELWLRSIFFDLVTYDCGIPFQNAFAEKLGPFGFNPYPMFVVDLLHEFELGVWKTTFIHIIRILYAVAPGGEEVAKLNARLFDLRPLQIIRLSSNHNTDFVLSPLLVQTQYVASLTMLPR